MRKQPAKRHVEEGASDMVQGRGWRARDQFFFGVGS
jgi:hypothetical protein